MSNIKRVEHIDFEMEVSYDCMFVVNEHRSFDEDDNLLYIHLETEDGIIWTWDKEHVRVIDTVTFVSFTYNDVFGLRFFGTDDELDKQYYKNRFMKAVEFQYNILMMDDLDDNEERAQNHMKYGRF